MVGMAVGDVVVVEVGDADAPSLKRAGDGCAGVDENRPAALGNDQAGGIILSRKGGADSGKTKRQPLPAGITEQLQPMWCA